MSLKTRTLTYISKATALLIILLTGCTQIQRPDTGVTQYNPVMDFAVKQNIYRLQAGDRVTLIVLAKADIDNYLISPGDQIDIYVQDREDLTTVYDIGPNSILNLRQLKPLSVSGSTLNDIKQKISQSYREQGLQNYVTVGLKRFNTPLQNFMQNLSQSQTQSNPYKATLEIDGKANFPLIGIVDLAGKTLIEANKLVAEKYSTLFQNADITLRIDDSNVRTVTILGAVTNPGAYPVMGSVSLLNVIGAAKGYTDEARLDSIITMQPRDGKLYVNQLDLESNIIQVSGVQVSAGDIIYVPKQRISDINRFVDQYIKRNIPILINLPLTTLFL